MFMYCLALRAWSDYGCHESYQSSKVQAYDAQLTLAKLANEPSKRKVDSEAKMVAVEESLEREKACVKPL